VNEQLSKMEENVNSIREARKRPQDSDQFKSEVHQAGKGDHPQQKGGGKGMQGFDDPWLGQSLPRQQQSMQSDMSGAWNNWKAPFQDQEKHEEDQPGRTDVVRCYGFGSDENMAESPMVQKHLEAFLKAIQMETWADIEVLGSHCTKAILKCRNNEGQGQQVRDEILKRWKAIPSDFWLRKFGNKEVILAQENSLRSRIRNGVFYESAHKLEHMLQSCGLKPEIQPYRKAVLVGTGIVA